MTFAELDHRSTPIGDVSLRRRRDPVAERDVYEVKLGDEFLMSSLFTAAEEQLAHLTLARCPFDELDVLVGGLGLGYTAAAALEDDRLRSLVVAERLDAVIDWHERRLLPLGEVLMTDPRCRLVERDFFATVADGADFGDDAPRLFHAVLLDIDHTPDHHLDGGHADFYSGAGLRRLARRIEPGGAFGLWSDAAPDDDFLQLLRAVFADADAEVVAFPNPYTGGESTNTVYVATTA